MKGSFYVTVPRIFVLHCSFEDFERADVVEARYENFESSVIGFAASYFLSLVILY